MQLDRAGGRLFVARRVPLLYLHLALGYDLDLVLLGGRDTALLTRRLCDLTVVLEKIQRRASILPVPLELDDAIISAHVVLLLELAG